MEITSIKFTDTSKAVGFEVCPDIMRSKNWIVKKVQYNFNDGLREDDICTIEAGKIKWERKYRKPSDDIKEAVKEILEHLKKSGLI